VFKKPIKNTLITAPIQIGNEKRILIVRLRMVKGQDNKFYLHDIFVMKDFLKIRTTLSKPVAQENLFVRHFLFFYIK